MDFVMALQYLGYHVPALGAFLALVIVVCLLCLVAFKLGKRSSDKKWKWDVEHMPEVIGQDIRESFERKIAVLQARLSWTQGRLNVLEPFASGIAGIVKQHKVG